MSTNLYKPIAIVNRMSQQLVYRCTDAKSFHFARGQMSIYKVRSDIPYCQGLEILVEILIFDFWPLMR